MIICPICSKKLDSLPGKYKCKDCSKTFMSKDGIFSFTKKIKNSDYNPKSLKKLYQLEQKHFWFVNRKKTILNLFQKYIPKNSSIIELGAGTGNIALSLQKLEYKKLFVSDLYIEGLCFAQKYGLKNLYQIDITQIPFLAHFDAVGMFDVLEHFEKDEEILKNVHQILKKNGKLVFTVPAHKRLWSRIDTNSGHKRRYSKKEIITKLKANGYKVIYARYFFVSLLPFLFIRSLINSNQDTRNKTEDKVSGLLNPFFNILLALENRLLKNIPPPAGGSLIVIGEKDDSV